MHVVHRGFDTIALSVQANISSELFELLNTERERAEENRAQVPVTYGGADFDLLPYGGNGYRFILKGGPLDVTWFFKKPNARDPWGIRISVGSTLLATQGLGYARAYIDKTLTRLSVRFEAHQVSIARVDFCVDILAPSFELAPENFVIHSHANRADYLASQDDVRSNGKSGRFTSVTFTKKDGTERVMRVQPAALRQHVKGEVASEAARKAIMTRARRHPHLLPVWDAEARAARSVNLATVTRIAADGHIYHFPN
ncbi:hypothetical protein [Ruegeria sp. HKCCD8929]|uniref:hypothetical protein n=1 Tax=Ruegeria sp. HKCCD8929 TaxID=2683006 RepID=UPI001489385D|nr:hypothetical protein [Ruegeria sp. HKCCD8929]